MKRIVVLLLVVVTSLGVVTGCSKNKALDFKNEYESLNGKTNKSGKEHRSVTIPKDNPYEKVSPKKIVEMIDNKETFYVYFGDKLCPWCRSVIEKSCEVAKKNGIEKIYYVDIWDDDGNEIFRDKYKLEDGKVTKVSDGTEEYYRLLKEFEQLLSYYTLTDDGGNKFDVGEKRIFAPNYIYVDKGKPIMLVEGISEKQKDSREKLTEDMLKDEEDQFNSLFTN